MDRREIGWECMDWIHLGSCEYSNDLYGSIKGGEFLDWLNVLSASQERLRSV
jgi:hypothetical protein